MSVVINMSWVMKVDYGFIMLVDEKIYVLFGLFLLSV